MVKGKGFDELLEQGIKHFEKFKRGFEESEQKKKRNEAPSQSDRERLKRDMVLAFRSSEETFESAKKFVQDYENSTATALKKLKQVVAIFEDWLRVKEEQSEPALADCAAIGMHLRLLSKYVKASENKAMARLERIKQHLASAEIWLHGMSTCL